MRRMVTTCAVAVLLTTGAASVATSAAAADEPPAAGCWDVSVVVQEGEVGDQTGWTYTHVVDWCGDGISVTEVGVDAEFEPGSGDTCEWKGVADLDDELTASPVPTFSMGELICRAPGGEVQQVNPWVVVNVHGDGRHEQDKGIARTPVVSG